MRGWLLLCALLSFVAIYASDVDSLHVDSLPQSSAPASIIISMVLIVCMMALNGQGMATAVALGIFALAFSGVGLAIGNLQERAPSKGWTLTDAKAVVARHLRKPVKVPQISEPLQQISEPQLPRVFFTDIEGDVKRMNSIFEHAEKAGNGKAEYHFLGDVFDHDGEQMVEDIFTAFKERKVKSVYGNRDLNKLRFLTELSPKFIEFLGRLKPEQRLYCVMRLLYWTIHSRRPEQVIRYAKVEKTVKGWDSLSDWTAIKGRWAEFLGANSLGCPRYTTAGSKSFSCGKKSVEKCVFDYISTGGSYKNHMTGAKWMDLVDGTLIAHTTLGDGDLLGEEMASPAIATHAWDPYVPFGGLNAAMEKINKKLKAAIGEAYKQQGNAPKKLIDVLERELAELDKQETKLSIATLTKFLEKMQPAKWIDWRDGIAKHCEGDAFCNLIATKLMTPLGRPGELALDAAVPYPTRTKLYDEGEAVEGYIQPSATTNNAITYYLELKRILDQDKPEDNKEKLTHLMDLCKNKVRVVVTGHFGVAGPIIIRYRKDQLTKLKKLLEPNAMQPVENDIYVVFIDSTGYVGKKEANDFLKYDGDRALVFDQQWMYVREEEGMYSVYFKVGDTVHEVELNEKDDTGKIVEYKTEKVDGKTVPTYTTALVVRTKENQEWHVTFRAGRSVMTKPK